MTDQTEWPQWLRAADTEDAIVEIRNGRVIWKDGVWKDGVWKDGVWEGGVWEDGVWEDGVWKGGVWEDGVWEGGFCNPTRAYYSVLSDGRSIKIGCQQKSIEEWRQIIDGTVKPPLEAPPRDSDAWKLLVASFEACVTYHRILSGDD